MLRCCQLILCLHNRHGSKNVFIPWPSQDVTDRRASYATKLNSWDGPLRHTKAQNEPGTNTGSTVRGSTLTLGHTHYGFVHFLPESLRDSLPSQDQLETGPGGKWTQGDSMGVLFAQGLVQRPPVSNPEAISTCSLRTHMDSGSPGIVCRTGETSQHHIEAPRTTDIALLRDSPVDPAEAFVPVIPGDLASAVRLVRDLVDNTASSSPKKPIADVLKSVTRTFGSELLRNLNAKQSSELLCLFGTASDNGSGRKYYGRYGGRIQEDVGMNNYWKEVICVAEEKERMGHVLGERESFWSMRAYLEQLKLTGSPDMRKLAKSYRSRIPRCVQYEPPVLIPYLDAFLGLPSTSDFHGALHILFAVLAKQHNPHRDVVNLLWKVILHSGNGLPLTQKSRILDLFLHRISHFTSVAQTSIPHSLDGIITAFAASIFPCYQKSDRSTCVSLWVTDCVRASLAEEIPVKERFHNLVLIAMWLLPQELPSSPVLEMASNSHEWRAIIGLAILDRSLGKTTASPRRGDMQGVARSFWRFWKDIAAIGRPREVDRAILIIFLRIAAHLEDELLLDACMDHMPLQGLWVAPQDSESETRQVEQLYCSFTASLLAFRGQLRVKLLSLLGNASHSPSQRTQYIRNILQRLAVHDIGFAHQFYHDCLSHGIPVSPEASTPLARHLAVMQQWNEVIPFLQDPLLSGNMRTQLLETVLSVFQHTRQQSTAPIVARVVGDILLRLYSTVHIPDKLKYPIRFFLPIMIASRQPQLAVELLETFMLNNPFMFTMRFFLRIIHTLLHHRQSVLAVKTFQLASTSLRVKPGGAEVLRRKVLQGLMHNGALKLALGMKSRQYQLAPRSIHDELLHLSARRPSGSVKLALFRLLPLVATHPVSGTIISSAVQVSVQNRHFGLARRLIQQSHEQLKSQDLTAVCNVYLHAPMLHRNMRNGRLVRHVLRVKDFLVQQYGYVPDRATVNIVIKAMLRWRVFMDSRRVRSLFDHLIRNGYPASERWHTANAVPFGTPSGETLFELSGIRQNMSFKRHVRPLYRMFIKELFIRKDPRAARRVIGILKEEEVQAMQRKEHRERARRLGIAKKQRQRSLDRSQTSVGNDGISDK